MTMRIVSLAVAVSAWLMGSVGLAQAQVIYPVSTTAPYAPNLASPVTVTLSVTVASFIVMGRLAF